MTEISYEARRLAAGHPFEADRDFLVALTVALAGLHATAPRTEAIHEATVARLRKLEAEHAEAVEAARRAGAAAERERIRAIVTSAEAEGRRAVAEALAFRSDLPAPAAITALKAAPAAPAWGGAAALTDAQRARAEAALAGPRAKDAPGGLVLADGASLPAGATAAVVSAGPDEPPKPGASRAKALWKAATDALNREMKAN